MRRSPGTVVRFGTVPPLPSISEDLHWRPALAINLIYAGPVEEGEEVLRPLREHGRPLIDLVSAKPYLAHQSAIDGTVPHGWHYYWKSTNLPELSDGLIDLLVEHGFSARSPRSYAVLFHLGGAVARIADDSTAYPGRRAPHNININGVWRREEADELAETDTAWVRRFFAALEPYREGVYVNFLASDDDASRVREAYGDRYERLVELKTRWDPDNVFRINQNIEPREARS